MAIYQLAEFGFQPIEVMTFAEAGVKEREHLQHFLKQQVEVVSPDTLIIAAEFADWDESRRRIDLLGVDKEANLVVIELKRTEDGGHMELQTLRYAAMASAMTFADAVNAFDQYLQVSGEVGDARDSLLQFLEWETPDEQNFAQDVRIVLASAEFSKEVTTSVLWLNDHGLDIRCIRLTPHRDGDRILLDVQQVIPLPEAEEYQVKIRGKAQLERVSRTQSRDLTKFDVTIDGETDAHLSKRRAIFAVVKQLCRSGVNPEKIQEAIAWRGHMLRSVPGQVKSAKFHQLLAKQLIAEGNQPQTNRYFANDDELIYANGKTYALSKMWGRRTAEAIDLLLATFPKFSISYEARAEN
ncbi:MAG: hypothetical protein Q8L44_04865 [Sulfuritalea sp.]|nr:hypothetical protein [Sulfuritalea sp.]